jgi:hypothetical protein
METTGFVEMMSEFRTRIKTIAKDVKDAKELKMKHEVNEIEDGPEVLANMTLAYRHLEDAAMRLGKVIQAYDGGVSVYDK